MSTFRHMMRDFIHWAIREDKQEMEADISSNKVYPKGLAISRAHNDSELGGRPLRFCVHKASGGRVVEVAHYDPVRDHTTHSMHLITDDADFGKAIDKIITLEYLKA